MGDREEMETEFAFQMISWNSSILIRQWDPRKSNIPIVVIRFLNIVGETLPQSMVCIIWYMTVKIWSSIIWVRLKLVYHRGKFCSSSFWVQLMSGLDVFNVSIAICKQTEVSPSNKKSNKNHFQI